MINKPLSVLAAVLTVAVVLLANDRQGFLRVDAGGPKLRMQLIGAGSPAVVFENGGNAPFELWGGVPTRVSAFARVVTYDRAGVGLSDESTTPRDGRTIAAELHTALKNANVPPPYVLVGHSLGGPYIRIFAGMYPSEVAGMVLVDPTQEGMVEWNDEHGFTQASERPEFISAALDDARESQVPPNIPVFLIHVMQPWPHGPFQSKEMDAIAARVASRVPLRLKFHREWVDRVPGAQFISTDISSHGGINFEEPELVVETIRRAVTR